MLILTEEEWFDKYYPKELGNWREYYNMKAYSVSGCTWLNYKSTGFLACLDNGLMKVNKRSNNPYIESSLFQVNEDIGSSFCAANQKQDGTYWVQGTIYKRESNLYLYTIKLDGIDDISYSKDFIGLDNVLEGWNKIPYVLSDWDNLKKENYYFTN